MKATAQVTNPNEVEVTIKIVGTLKWWKDLKSQMDGDKWPSCEITRSITDLVNQTERVYYEKTEIT